MAKIKVHELAKELGINSKDIIETLADTDFAVKAAQSNVEDAAQDIVRKKFGKGAAKAEEKKETTGTAKKAATKTTTKTAAKT